MQAQGAEVQGAEAEALMVEGHVGHPLSAVPDQGLRAYPLRDMPELPSGRRTATQDHPTILGQYRYRRSQAGEAAVLTKMFQGTSHSRSFCLQRINASRTSSCCTRRQCTAQAYRHTHMGRTSRAGEGELNWYCVGQQAGRGSTDFSDETSFRLVREIVTVANEINL